MKYKAINEDYKNKGLLESVLENRNITKEDVDKLLNAGIENYKDPFDIYNMNKAVEQFQNLTKEKNKIIGIVTDSDMDGIASSSIFYRMLVEDIEYPKDKIEIFIHDKKQHGINAPVFKEIIKSDVKYLIIPDAGTNDIKEMKKLNEKNVDILVLDHHVLEINLDEVPKNTIIVNNQIGDCPSKHGSGTLVTSKFIEALGLSVDKYMDLIGISLISDSMDLLDLENRYYVNTALSNIENSLVKAFLKKNKIKNPTIKDISFNLVNFINAVIRVGSKEDKRLIFDAIINKEEIFDYKKRNGDIIKETLQEKAVRISSNAKSKQNNAAKKSVQECNKNIVKLNLNKNKVIILKNEDNFIDHSQTGLVAMKLCDEWKRPCIILNKLKDGFYAGSVRAVGVDDFKSILDSTGLCEWARGHANAHGIKIKGDNIEHLTEELNKILKDFKFTDSKVYDVDNIIDIKNLREKDIKEIADLERLWGGELKEPMFCIRNIQIDSIKIKMVGKLTCMFESNGFKFIKNWCSKDFYNSLTNADELKFGRSQPLRIDLIISFKKDKYGKYYCEIVDANSKKDDKIIF